MGLVRALPEETIREPGACGIWSIQDILAHLHAWHKMYLTWYTEGMAGRKAPMPAPGFTWKETPQLNEKIYCEYKNHSLAAVLSALKSSHEQIDAIIEDHTQEELFTKKRYGWTGSTSVGSYTISATSSHYDWAISEIKKFLRSKGN